MKKLIFKFLVLCLMLVFFAASAYAGTGRVTAGSYNFGPASNEKEHKKEHKDNKRYHEDDSEESDDDDEYDDDEYDDDDEDERDHERNRDRDHEKEDKHKKDKKDKKNEGNKKGHEYVAVEDITINKTSLSLAVGSWERLTAAVQPADATDKKFYWFSGNPRVASVNPSGKVTGLAPGTAVIYAATRDGFKTDYCTVTVTGSSKTVHVTGVTLNRTALTMDAGEGRRLTATITPGNATNKAVAWSSSNTAVATVDRNGYVSALKAGTAVITVRTEDGGKTASCTVTVRSGAQVPVTSVSIVKTRSYIALQEGATRRLDIEILPDNATDKNVTWRTNDSGIVTVNRYGEITGVHEGTATVTVTTADGRKSDSVLVEVIPANEWVRPTGVDLNLVSTTIPVGFTEKLRYGIEPAHASDKEVRWSSSNSDVASVNGYGVIEAKRTGTAVITVTTVDGSKTDSCFVVVVPALSEPSRGILLNKTASTLTEGEYDYPVVLFYPSNEDDYALTWTSSDTTVATVNQNGRVTAVEPGTAVITVRTSNNRSASYTVTVE